MPIITVAKNKSQSEYIKKLRLVYAVLALTGIFAFIITSASAPFIIGLLYGDTFNQGSTILAIYAFSNIPGYIGVAHGIWMVNDKKIKLSIYRSTAGAITCIFLSLSLIPKYGIIGAAISTIFALIVSDIVVPIILNIKLFNQIVNFKNSTIK
jgi:O-antigen/teichoic acid export membrane protein